MRVLLLCHGFNSLSQRLFTALREDGHEVAVELDIADAVTQEALRLWRPDVLIAPYLKRRLPTSVWQALPCWIVHPGPPGDRGPAALDWAVQDGETTWGVTVLQADGEYDAGPVLAHATFATRADRPKSSWYRQEVAAAAVAAVREAITRHGGAGRELSTGGSGPAATVRPSAPHDAALGPVPAASATYAAPGWRPGFTRAQRRIDWADTPTAEALRRVHAADGHPGALVTLAGTDWRAFDAHPVTPDALAQALAAHGGAAQPGTLLARRGPALMVRTRDGALWLGHLRREGAEPCRADARTPAAGLKLPAVTLLADAAAALPELGVPLQRPDGPQAEWDELRYEEWGPPGARVGWLHAGFHNGATGERACARWVEALREAKARDTRVLVLAGGEDFFANGIHLHEIEHAQSVTGDSAAEAAWRQIRAIDDVVLELLDAGERLTVAALRGNAGAGGCYVALACDRLWAHEGVVLNPHYRNMGNLHGSEYWTWTLPRRVGEAAARALMQERLPLGAAQAARRGLLDEVQGTTGAAFEAWAREAATRLAVDPGTATLAAARAAERADPATRAAWADARERELAAMHRQFFGADPSFHVARHHFVHRKPMAFTPRHLAPHREPRMAARPAATYHPPSP